MRDRMTLEDKVPIFMLQYVTYLAPYGTVVY